MGKSTKIFGAWRDEFEDISNKLGARSRGEFKADRTARQFEGLVHFREQWREERLGKIEHALAVWAYDEGIPFVPTLGHASDILLARLVLNQTRGVGAEWGKALYRVRTGSVSLKDALRDGVRVTSTAPLKRRGPSGTKRLKKKSTLKGG